MKHNFVIHPANNEGTLSFFLGNSDIERSNISAVTQHIEDKHSLLPCEFCGTLYTIESLEKHQVLCSSNLEICSRCQEYFTSVQLTSHVCSPSLTERGIVSDCSNKI
jgi:hypothetical protein